MKEEETIKTIKGFDHNLQCRGKQFEVGQTYTEEGDIKVCEHGMHAISPDASPLSVFNYYPPSVNGKLSRYCEVEASGDIASCEEKIAASKLTVGAEIGIPGIVKAHIEWVKRNIKEKKEGGDRSSVSGGYRSSVSGGYGSSVSGGNRSSVSGGDRSSVVSKGSSAVGVNGVAVARGNDVKVKGGMGALLVIAKENSNDYNIKEWKAAIVDGETIKADTWYTVENGEWKEAIED